MEHTFTGTLKWAKIYPGQESKKYDPSGKWSLNFYPKDKETRERIRGLQLRAPLKEDEDGFFYTFTRKVADPYLKGNIIVKGEDGQDLTDAIGNGSEANVTVEVYQWDNNFGKGNGAKIIKVEMVNFIPYTKDDKALPV